MVFAWNCIRMQDKNHCWYKKLEVVGWFDKGTRRWIWVLHVLRVYAHICKLACPLKYMYSARYTYFFLPPVDVISKQFFARLCVTFVKFLRYFIMENAIFLSSFSLYNWWINSFSTSFNFNYLYICIFTIA